MLFISSYLLLTTRERANKTKECADYWFLSRNEEEEVLLPIRSVHYHCVHILSDGWGSIQVEREEKTNFCFSVSSSSTTMRYEIRVFRQSNQGMIYKVHCVEFLFP